MAKKKLGNNRAITSKQKTIYTNPEKPLLTGLSLRLIRLIETSSKLEIVSGKLPGDDLSVQLEAHVARINDNFLIVTLRASVETPEPEKGPVEGPNTEKHSFVKFRCVAQCLFDSEDVLPPAEQPLASINELLMSCRMMVWPHIRLFVQSTSASMGIRPFILPMIYGQQMFEQLDEK